MIEVLQTMSIDLLFRLPTCYRGMFDVALEWAHAPAHARNFEAGTLEYVHALMGVMVTFHVDIHVACYSGFSSISGDAQSQLQSGLILPCKTS